MQPAQKFMMVNESPTLFFKKPLCTGNLLPMHKIFMERPDKASKVTFNCRAYTRQ